MNRRFALLTAACLVSALMPGLAFSQVKPATATTPASTPAPVKWVPPVRGDATVEFMQSKPVRGKDTVDTKFKLRNTSKGSIALLTVEEIWYNQKGAIVSNGMYRHKALLNPGEVIEFTVSSAVKPDLYSNNLMFKHANGKVEPKRVPKF
jgi:hypothetical protein